MLKPVKLLVEEVWIVFMAMNTDCGDQHLYAVFCGQELTPTNTPKSRSSEDGKKREVNAMLAVSLAMGRMTVSVKFRAALKETLCGVAVWSDVTLQVRLV